MSVTLDELNRFHGFAVQKIDAGEEWTLQDLIDQWELAGRRRAGGQGRTERLGSRRSWPDI